MAEYAHMSDVVEERTADEFLGYELKNGYFPYERSYTLKDYLDGISSSSETVSVYSMYPMREINRILKKDDIPPIPYHYEDERQAFACMISCYAGAASNGHTDAPVFLNMCINFAKTHDFLMTRASGQERWVIDTDAAERDARLFAEEVCRAAGRETGHGIPDDIKNTQEEDLER